MRELLPVRYRPERGQKPDRKESRVSNNYRNFLLMSILQTLLSCSVLCPNADENGHKTSHRTESGQHNYLLNNVLWKSVLRWPDGFFTNLATRETGFHSHSLSEGKMTFGFTMPKEESLYERR